MRRATAVVTLLSFVMVFSKPLFAAEPSGSIRPVNPVTHSLTSVQLHEAVQLSHQRAVAARDVVSGFLNRPDVKTSMRRLGLSPDRVAARTAALSDQEMLRLQDQIMAADLQNSPAGLSTGAIIAIVAAGVAGLLILTWIMVESTDDVIYY